MLAGLTRLFATLAALPLLAAPVATAAEPRMAAAAEPRMAAAAEPRMAAAAEPVEDAVAGLRDASMFLHPQANRQLDVGELERAIGNAPIKIAVLPKKSASEDYPVSEIRTWPRLVSQQLPGHTIALISGRRFYAGSDVLCQGLAGQAASRAIYANEGVLDAAENSDLTKMLADFVVEVRNARRCSDDPAGRGDGDSASRGDRYGDEPGSDAGGTSEAAVADDTATVLPWVLGAVALGVLAVGGWVLASRHRARGRAARDRARTRLLVERLGAELSELSGLVDGDPAVADAAGKHREASALLIGATTDVQFGTVRHAVIEGLTAARAARLAAGREPGEAVPPFAGEAVPSLAAAVPPFAAAAGPEPTAAAAGLPAADPAGQPTADPAGQPTADPDGLPYQPLPRYAPGSPHFYAGSAAVPAGWYPQPFWTVGPRTAEPANPLAHSRHHA
jgi:hypothetical protein